MVEPFLVIKDQNTRGGRPSRNFVPKSKDRQECKMSYKTACGAFDFRVKENPPFLSKRRNAAHSRRCRDPL